MTILNQSMETEQNCVKQTLIALLFIFLLKIFLNIFPVTLKDGLIHLTMVSATPLKMRKDHFQQVRIKKYPVFLKMNQGERLWQKLSCLDQKHGCIWDDGSEKKKDKGTKKFVIKRRLMFENCKDYLFNEKTIFKKQQKFKSYCHDVYTKESNKVALSSNDNKRIQKIDKVLPQKSNCF